MKKLTLLSIISSTFISSLAMAGTMGGAGTMCCSPFVSLEAGYTWNDIGGFDLALQGVDARVTSVESNRPFTGRLAAGMMGMMRPDWGFTSELGWGYYGKTRLNSLESGVINNVPASLAISHDLSGFDALMGLAFVQRHYSLFLKGGALFENMQTDTNAVTFPFGNMNTLALKTNTTAVLPEVKLGAAYNFTPHWALTGSYLHAWGSNPETTGTFNVNTFSGNLNINSQNPSIDTLLMGVQYTA